MFGVHDQLLLLRLILHRCAMDDLYFVDEYCVMGELAHLIHRIRVDS
jgi:hypothetical protein